MLVMSLKPIIYVPGKLNILDQLLLPLESKYFEVKSVEDGWTAIRKMQVNEVVYRYTRYDMKACIVN